MIRIAIDGPGGAGKSTVAKRIADQMNLEYIDTGAMYRAIGYKLLREDVRMDNEDVIRNILEHTVIDFRDNRIFLDGEDVGSVIRMPEVSRAASDCSRLACVRTKLVALQREIASGKNVVMDGRDIGTNVLPDAEVKIFLTADPMVRARRRYEQLLESGKEADLQSIYEDIRTRDEQDMNRELNPLRQASDAVLLDTSDMTIDDVVHAIEQIAGEKHE